MPEFSATARSRPVPTTGASVISSGTACRCMFEPIRARLASSCSRNGISPAETPTIWHGAMSMKSTCLALTQMHVVAEARQHAIVGELALSSTGVSAGAT